MRSWLEKYFGFNHRELNGVAVLATVLILVWGAAGIYRQRFSEYYPNRIADVQEIERFLNASANAVVLTDTAERFVFDPNGLSVSDWERLGLTERQVRMIKNYEAKGGRFRRKEDVAKIYAISDDDYARLAPYIQIKESTQVNLGNVASATSQVSQSTAFVERPAIVRPAAPVLHIELNTADSLMLQALPGIGPVFASRIVRFRDLLGGFYQVEQLLSVYGMDTVRYDGLKALVFADTTAIRKIPVNVADYEQLRRHPYIGSKLARLIVQYRKQHGKYIQLADLTEIVLMDEENFRRIAPYLDIADD